MSHNATHTIIIEKLITGGYGLGRLDNGMVVHVPFVLPGEKVRIQPIKKHAKYIVAEVLEILEPSSERVMAPCRFFGTCGGCNLQHISYEAQVLFKRQILEEILSRAGVLSEDTVQSVSGKPIASPDSFNYRMRIRLHVDQKRKGMGFYQFHTHKITAVDRCSIARQEINDLLDDLYAHADFLNLLKNTDSVELYGSPGDNSVTLLLNLTRGPRPRDKVYADELCNAIPTVKGLFFAAPGITNDGPYTGDKVGVEPFVQLILPENVVGKRIILTHEVGGFSQVNQLQNENLIQLLLAWADLSGNERILDLFCGMGNFSLPLANIAGEVVGMDLQRSAIRSAKRNAALNGIMNCTFINMSAEDGIKNICARKENFDLVLLDPPRQGCAEVIPYLAGSKIKKILYISCDPATLARDLKKLLAASYIVRKVRMVDMFPQTHHMETITLLERI
jgi:23S rRNA (uracil1939-C5)-methyltransferase